MRRNTKKANCIKKSKGIPRELSNALKRNPNTYVVLKKTLKKVKNLTRKNKKNYINDFLESCLLK